MLFLVLQANYFEKISLILIFSLVNPNAPGLNAILSLSASALCVAVCSELLIVYGPGAINALIFRGQQATLRRQVH